jgi:hypothetical protein
VCPRGKLFSNSTVMKCNETGKHGKSKPENQRYFISSVSSQARKGYLK